MIFLLHRLFFTKLFENRNKKYGVPIYKKAIATFRESVLCVDMTTEIEKIGAI